MKTILLAVSALAFASLVDLAPAAAQQPYPAVVGTPHWEWQYHYVGHHPRYEGHWVLVR